jgi:hypothetical protein
MSQCVPTVQEQQALVVYILYKKEPWAIRFVLKSNNNKEDNIKVIFDFDWRLPAEPYELDFTATECATKWEGLDASGLQKLEGKKGIPKRE